MTQSRKLLWTRAHGSWLYFKLAGSQVEFCLDGAVALCVEGSHFKTKTSLGYYSILVDRVQDVVRKSRRIFSPHGFTKYCNFTPKTCRIRFTVHPK